MVRVPKPDLWAIMASIQALASTVSSLQLASGSPQTGGPRRDHGQQQAPARTHPPGATTTTRPPPENLGQQTQKAALDTLAAIGASNKDDLALSAFPALFTLIKENQGTTQGHESKES